MAKQEGSAAESATAPKAAEPQAAGPEAQVDLGAVTKKLDQLGDLVGTLQEARASDQKEIAELRKQLAAKPQGPPEPTKSEREAAQARLEAKLRDQQADLVKQDRWLLDGPQRFQVSLAGESRMTRIVGATSDIEAQAKFQRFFGIRSVMDPNRQIQVGPAMKPGDPAALTDLDRTAE